MMGNVELDIGALKGLTSDSRKVEAGYLFAALPGVQVDGCDFIGDAIEAGATAVLAPEGIDASGVQLVTDENPRQRFALIAAAFYNAQPDYIAAVTGTNGKTSVVHFMQQLWEALGVKAASLGTLGLHGAGFERSGSLTTPDPVVLHAELKELSEGGVTHLAIEASSHGLDQYRLDGVRIKAAGFTNLSRDHLDYHESMEDYLAAKTRLFTEILEPGGTAVLNADVGEFFSLKKKIKNGSSPNYILHSSKEGGEGGAPSGGRVLSYGFAGEDLKILSATPTPQGQNISISVMGSGHDLELPLVGDFQLMNALCALGLVIAQEPENTARTEKLVKALENLEGAPGRLQPVSGHPEGAAIYVDYAHTPDALAHALNALRPHTEGKLVCLFGCGGDRDHGKRPMMGEIAEKLSDLVIVTDDNPRSEDPAAIRAEIMKAVPNATEISGRREAISSAIKELQQGDVLIIAGKGHEQGQIFSDRTEEFDDVNETVKAIKGEQN